jgi:demethylmenaquinone methyltransferase/2-methoxy-6-polyprenyl-1,4-benzoquinol methylase
MSVERHLSDPTLKQQFVTPMFDIIAPRYDAFTRVFSFGMDARWKTELIDALTPQLPPAGGVALDLACGTGDIALAVAARMPTGRVIGIDASPRMIELARARSGNIEFAVGDMMRLDLPDASVDVVTAGYALRNVPDPRAAIREIGRVLAPGGRLYTLDFYRPAATWWRRLFLGYLSAAGNLVGWLWHREPVVYGYIARSVDHFMTADAFSAALTENGFALHHVSRKLLGGIAVHSARRI